MNRHDSAHKAFTLIEVLLVILILGLLAGLAIYAFSGVLDVTTQLVQQVIPSALDTYNMNIGHYPTADEGGLAALRVKPTFSDDTLAAKWRGPYLTQDPVDAWGRALQYEVQSGADATAAPYKLWSSGPNGTSGDANCCDFLHPHHPGVASQVDHIVGVLRAVSGHDDIAFHQLTWHQWLIQQEVEAVAADVPRCGAEWVRGMAARQIERPMERYAGVFSSLAALAMLRRVHPQRDCRRLKTCGGGHF